MRRFFYYYLRSMRLYYCFVTGTTTLLGVVFWLSGKAGGSPGAGRDDLVSIVLVLACGFLSWGVNQIFSDYCDRREDAVNAPHRPMVTGALPSGPAMFLSGIVMLVFGAVSYWLNPWSLCILGLGGALNLAYSHWKKIPALNCLIYACAVSCCSLFSFCALDKTMPSGRLVLPVLLFVVPAHFFMCHNSYYKDVAGDRAAGIHTLQVLFPKRLSLAVTVCGCLAAYAYLAWAFAVCPSAGVFLLLLLQIGIVTLNLLSMLRAILRERYHLATCRNCQYCVVMLYSGIMIICPTSMVWEVASLLAIELLFRWYRDEKE